MHFHLALKTDLEDLHAFITRTKSQLTVDLLHLLTDGGRSPTIPVPLLYACINVHKLLIKFHSAFSATAGPLVFLWLLNERLSINLVFYVFELFITNFSRN